MKLLIYSHFFAPSVGGTETIVLSIARGLAELRTASGLSEFEITLVTQTPAENFDDRLLPFQVLRQPSLWQLWRLVRSSDVIHVAGPALSPLVLGFAMRKPIVVEHHGFQAICPNGQLLVQPSQTSCPGHFMARRHMECYRCNLSLGAFGSGRLWLLTFVRRSLCKRAFVNISPTGWLQEQLRLPRAKTIHHGLEPSSKPQRQSMTGTSAPIVAYVGRLVSTKGVSVLFEATRLLRGQGRSVQLLVIGDGPERASLEIAARTPPLAGHVRLLGRVSSSQMNAELSRAHAVVVPSLAGEVFGLVLAENMQKALPLIVSDLGSFKEVLGNTGLIFRTGDPADLARQVGLLLDDPQQAASLGQQASSRVETQFSHAKMVSEHAEIYRSLLKTN